MRKLTMIMCMTGVSLTAQWPDRPSPGIPRTPDGKPNLSAPAPRTADGKPDLSGVWRVTSGNALFHMTGDLKPDEIRPWAAAIYKQREKTFRKDTDGIACLPPGPKAGIGVGVTPLKILQTPALVAILYEYHTLFRQIFTDGRALPEDPNPTWMGYSVGHWEGEALVVTTAGYNDRTTLDLAGHPHSESLRLTERYQRRDAGHMDLQVTFDDPQAYTRPWTLPIRLELVPDGDLIEYVCENERDRTHMVGQIGEESRVPADVMARYIGSYKFSEFPEPAVVSLEQGQLMIDMGTGKIPLIARSETSFTMEGTGVDFVKDASGAVIALIQHWTERDRYFARRK